MRGAKFGLYIRQQARFLQEMQATTGCHFDKELAEASLKEIDKLMKELSDDILPQMPKVYHSKSAYAQITKPKRLFKNCKKGVTHSVSLVNWCIKQGHIAYSSIEGVPRVYTGEQDYDIGEERFLAYELPMEASFDLYSSGHMKQLKEFLMTTHGWRPFFWNYKKDAAGKPVWNRQTKKKEVTGPKFQDQGNLCPNLEAMGDTVPFIKGVVKFVQLKHRRGVLQKKDGTGGWLGDPRVMKEGRISARMSALTNTLRQKHTGVCNVPKPETFFGDRLRGCMNASLNMVCVGYDASSLEDMIKAHYAYRYDGGEYARKVSDPNYDAHTEMQQAGGLETRREAKPVNYGIQYNMQPAGLAEATGWTLDKAQFVWDKYWELNYGYAACQENLMKHWEAMNKKGIICPLSGLFLNSRSKNAIGSLLIQHSGAFIMDIAAVVMDKYLGGIKTDGLPHYTYKGKIARRVLMMHDEYLWECEPEIAEELLELGKESIREAGRIVKLNVPLDADGAVESNWALVH